MPSFQIAIEPNRRAAARFVGQVRRSLQKAYAQEQQKRGLSQSEIARLLKVHRSVINRELKGLKDMTLGRVGELSWAMGRTAVFSLEEPSMSRGTNLPTPPQILQTPPPALTASTTSQTVVGIPINTAVASAA